MTPTELREEADRLEELLQKRDVREAMRMRCESQGHEWSNCCSSLLRVYQACQWCGEERL